jgi:hypothetical protein
VLCPRYDINLVLHSNAILNFFCNTCNTGIPCARQNINFRFYVLERPDDDFMKVEACSLV